MNNYLIDYILKKVVDDKYIYAVIWQDPKVVNLTQSIESNRILLYDECFYMTNRIICIAIYTAQYPGISISEDGNMISVYIQGKLTINDNKMIHVQLAPFQYYCIRSALQKLNNNYLMFGPTFINRIIKREERKKLYDEVVGLETHIIKLKNTMSKLMEGD